jgi:hypothetical protein
MTSQTRFLLRIAQAGMEIIWLHAVITALCLAATGKSLPLWAATTVFACAYGCGRLTHGKGLRYYAVILLHIATFASAGVAVFLVALFFPHSGISSFWVQDFIDGQARAIEWVELVLLVISMAFFWLSAFSFVRRPMEYATICLRFDIGLAVFFGLFLVDMVIVSKGNSGLRGLTIYPVLWFCLLGFFAIGLARMGSHTSKSFIPGKGVVGITMTFLASVLFIVAGTVLCLLPFLTESARISYRAIAAGGHTIEPWMIGIVRFLFGPRKMLAEPSSSSPGATDFSHSLSPTTWLGRLVEASMEWTMKVLFGLTIVLGISLVLFLVFRWLLSKTTVVERTAPPLNSNRNWFNRLIAWIALTITEAIRLFKNPANGKDLYRRLLVWGKHGGTLVQPSETPAEFANNLAGRFQLLRNAIVYISDLYGREVYGERILTENQLSLGTEHMRFLRSPRLWFCRLKKRWASSGS